MIAVDKSTIPPATDECLLLLEKVFLTIRLHGPCYGLSPIFKFGTASVRLVYKAGRGNRFNKLLNIFVKGNQSQMGDSTAMATITK